MAAAAQLHTKYAEFVDHKVITIPVTETIIKAIMPSFPKSAKVISGYLSAEQLYWKVNYHWELLLWAIDKMIAAPPAEPLVLARLKEMKARLEAGKPNPASGYRTSSTPGFPKDLSSDETILTRHATVTSVKAEFKALVLKAKLDKLWKLDSKALMLSYAPVASPLKGKHRTGYALDIRGNNPAIKSIAKSLGATMTFDEGSHVHCEWKNGVDTSKGAGADRASAAVRAVDLYVNQNLANVRHFGGCVFVD